MKLEGNDNDQELELQSHLNVVVHNIFWITFVGMEGPEEYGEERSPLNEQNNSGKEPAREDITNNSSELLQII